MFPEWCSCPGASLLQWHQQSYYWYWLKMETSICKAHSWFSYTWGLRDPWWPSCSCFTRATTGDTSSEFLPLCLSNCTEISLGWTCRHCGRQLRCRSLGRCDRPSQTLWTLGIRVTVSKKYLSLFSCLRTVQSWSRLLALRTCYLSRIFWRISISGALLFARRVY